MANKVVKAGLGYTIGNYFIKGLVFLTLPIFTRIMNPSDFGLYNIFVAGEGILAVVIGFAFHTTYKNAWYKYRSSCPSSVVTYDQYVSSTIILILLNSLVWFIFVLLFSSYLTDLLLLDTLSLMLLVVYSTSMAILGCYNSHIAIQYKYKDFIIISFINAFFNILLSVFLILTIFENDSYIGRIVGTTFPAMLISALLAYKLIRKGRTFRPKALKWGLSYSLPIIPNGIGQVILSQFDRMMINKMISPFHAGLYSFAFNIFGIVNVTAISLDNAWSPWLYEKMDSKEYDKIKDRSSMYMLVIFLLSSLLMLICPEVICFLATPVYYESVYSAIPLIAGGFFLFLSSLPISVEYYYEKTKLIAVATFLAAILKIILNVVFLNEYGSISAGYTTLVTYIAYFIFHYTVAYKVFGGALFDMSHILKYSLGIIMVLFVSILLIDYQYIRWAMGFIMFLSLIYVEETYIGIIRNYLRS